MRIKEIWDVVPLPSKLRLAYSLVTLDLPTAIFFSLSLLQCLFQSGLHGWLVSHHQSFTLQINEVALNTQIISQPLVVLSGDHFYLCNAIPTFAGGPGKCIGAVFQEQHHSPNATVTLNANSTLVQTLASGTQPDRQCAEVFPWVFQELRAANREDMLFIAYQFWLFCISLSAIFFQSIPHLMATIASGILASVATAFRIVKTPQFEAKFEQLVTNGACHGIDLLPGYFPPRRIAEVMICVLNCTMFVVLASLSYRLIQTYGRCSFEKVRQRPDMSRLYLVLLSLSSSVHLAAFFIVAGLGVLTDQLVLGPLRDLALDRTRSIVIQAVAYVLVLPWMFLGWTCGRVESKPRTNAFIAITVVLLALWAGSFTCSTNRFVFLTWDFFAALNVAPGCLMVFILLLVIYIWRHLDLGLAAYLKCTEPPHPADQVCWSFATILPDTEKGDSPSPADGSTKPPVIWNHPQPSILRRALGTRSLSPSIRPISTESNKPSDRIAKQGCSSFKQRLRNRDLMVSQDQPSTLQPSALVIRSGRTTPVDITDSWVRRHIATSVILSASPTK